MNHALILLFLFSTGCLLGWIIELFYRRFGSPYGRKSHKWVNPGFLVGPCLPLYGSGLVILYLMARIPMPFFKGNSFFNAICTIILMGIAMTLIEYVTGLIFIVHMHVKLWDYSDNWGNIQGIICPLFSLFWTALGAFYYIIIDPEVLDALDWLSRNLAFSFFIGLFYGIFIIDFAYSFNLVVKVKQIAEEYQVVVKINDFRGKIIDMREKAHIKNHFLISVPSNLASIRDVFEEYKDNLDDFSIKKWVKKTIENLQDKQE